MFARLFARPAQFDLTKLSPKSQFSFSGGRNSCTYCSLEASIYLLHGLIFPDDPQLIQTIDKIVSSGVKLDKQLGIRSCDEAYSLVGRFRQQIQLGAIYFGAVRKGCFGRLLVRMEGESKRIGLGKKFSEDENENEEEEEGEENEKEEEEAPDASPVPVGIILTKPNQTILVFHSPSGSPYPFTIFDSHPRGPYAFTPTHGQKKTQYIKGGAGFYFFKTLEKCSAHLEELFLMEGIDDQMYEANFVTLKKVVEGEEEEEEEGEKGEEGEEGEEGKEADGDEGEAGGDEEEEDVQIQRKKNVDFLSASVWIDKTGRGSMVEGAPGSGFRFAETSIERDVLSSILKFREAVKESTVETEDEKKVVEEGDGEEAGEGEGETKSTTTPETEPTEPAAVDEQAEIEKEPEPESEPEPVAVPTDEDEKSMLMSTILMLKTKLLECQNQLKIQTALANEYKEQAETERKEKEKAQEEVVSLRFITEEVLKKAE